VVEDVKCQIDCHVGRGASASTQLDFTGKMPRTSGLWSRDLGI